MKLTRDVNSTWIINLKGRTTLCRFQTQKDKDTVRKDSVRGGTNTYRFTLYTKYQRQQQPPCNKTEPGHTCFVADREQDRWNYRDILSFQNEVRKQACPRSWPLLRSAYIRLQDPVEKRLIDTGSSKKRLWDYISQQPLWFRVWSPWCGRRRGGNRGFR